MADQTLPPLGVEQRALPPENRLARMASIVSRRSLAEKTPFPKLASQPKTQHRYAKILTLVAAGYTQFEIADHLGITRNGVARALYDMRKRGVGVDTEVKIDHLIVPSAVEQLQTLVEAGDKDAIFAVLKGRGAFKQHTAQPAGTGPTVLTQLVVKFEMPPGMTEKPVLQGQVVGVAREAER